MNSTGGSRRRSGSSGASRRSTATSPPSPSGPAWAGTPTGRLEATLEGLGELDGLERRLAVSGLSTLSSPRARLVLRHDREAWRRYREARKALAPLKIPAEERVASKPVPAPAPAPTSPTPDRRTAMPIAAGPVSGAWPIGETKPIPPRGMAPAPADFAASDDHIPYRPLDFTAIPPRRSV